ncbi:MAG TPA: thiamine-phosphate kinase [Bryobacteraceae bacterium]|nr:thiamine-phosphate kinase [Bryobacteraceae bacterium]
MVKHKRPIDEQTAIRRIARLAAVAPGRGATRLALGIGDDCAIFRPRAREDLLFTTDMLIEGRHFLPGTHRPLDLGWKALARGLSDIAAMGATPRFCLVSLALPPWADQRFMDGFYRGLLRLSRQEGVPLAGGDLARAETLFCDIVVCGAAPRGRALRRDTARAGDAVYVSGALGGSALGLALGRGPGWRRHLRPVPRLALGRFLRTRLRATAAMDLSDGLSLDLHRLALASGLQAQIEAPPVFPGASLAQALHGGEDYELLFTVSARTRVPARFETLPLTRIGTMQKGRPGVVLLAGQPLEALGFDHFRNP